MIRDQRPRQVFVVADGPRAHRPDDVERCAAVRAVVEQMDWPCDVRRNYADTNLGLKRRVSSGLDWVFRQVDRAIILEDDCLAQPEFFSFCDDLLERYADDERVWVITGNNFQGGRKRGDAAYYFSKYNHCWGWATWRRAWKHYQGHIPFWPEWRVSHRWREVSTDQVERKYWENIFDWVIRGEVNSWAYPWTATVWYHGGLTATPNANLVTNIGFGPDASHTKAPVPQEGVPLEFLGELRHPVHVVQERAADRFTFYHHFQRGDAKRLRMAAASLLRAYTRITRRFARQSDLE